MAETPRHCVDAAKLRDDTIRLPHGRNSYVFSVTMSTWKTYGRLGIIPYVEDVSVSHRLKQLRARAGLSMQEMARILDLKGASSYQRYEDPNLFKRKYLPYEKVDLLIRSLVGKGEPQITIVEVKALGGPVEPDLSVEKLVRRLDPEILAALRKLFSDDSTK